MSSFLLKALRMIIALPFLAGGVAALFIGMTLTYLAMLLVEWSIAEADASFNEFMLDATEGLKRKSL
jgi:hypothetical protein